MESRLDFRSEKFEQDLIGRGNRIFILVMVKVLKQSERGRKPGQNLAGSGELPERFAVLIFGEFGDQADLQPADETVAVRPGPHEGTLRCLRSFPRCDRRWEWPLIASGTRFECHGGRGDGVCRFRNRCPGIVGAGPYPSHAWPELRPACKARMLLRSTLEGESLYCLVGVAASTRSRAPAKSQVDATSHSLTRRLQLERT